VDIHRTSIQWGAQSSPYSARGTVAADEIPGHEPLRFTRLEIFRGYSDAAITVFERFELLIVSDIHEWVFITETSKPLLKVNLR
jgi:hypothetical protein